MPDTLALESLYQAVAARFALEGLGAVNVFGWRTLAQYPQGNRIAWVPGDTTGRAGSMAPPRTPGRHPRSLGTLLEQFTVTIDAADSTQPENELAQYKAARLLRDAWYAACYRAAHGTFRIVSEQWLTEKLERRYGASLQIVATVEAMVPELAPPARLAQAYAHLDVVELDASATIDTHPAASGTAEPVQQGGEQVTYNGNAVVFTVAS